LKLKGEWLLILGAMLVTGALYNHYMGHSALLVEIIMVAAGAVIAIYSTRYLVLPPGEEGHGILFDVLTRFVSAKNARLIIPMSGFALLLVWSTWKVMFLGMTDLRMEDFIVTLFGLSLVVYYSGPSQFVDGKDFATLYLLFLTIVFVVIWRAYFFATGTSAYEITSYSEFYIVTKPTAMLLGFLGFDVNAVLELDGIGLSNIIEYYHDGGLHRLGIGSGCSGLYSAGLFFSAFLAFVLSRYRAFDRYIGLGLAIGFFVTWLSNIIRMAITIIFGIAYGHQALIVVHSYIGILIFVASITAFWLLIVRWLDKVEKRKETGQRPVIPAETSAGS
jgi:exosortase/archaeosortase family protein